MTNTLAEERLFINGSWSLGTGLQRQPVYEAATGSVLGYIDYAAPADVDRAVISADRAFTEWAAKSWWERQAFLADIADHLESRTNELAERTARNNGKPLAEAAADVADAVACYRYYACLPEMDQPQPIPDLPGETAGNKQLLPIGVAALIVPWNFPLTTSAWKVAPALLAGCTLVLKVSEVTPFAELALATAALAAGVPAGVINIVVGGAECGAILTNHPLVSKISFTGSNSVGRLVMAAAAERQIPITLELGGKSAVVVFDDVDLGSAVDIVLGGIFGNAGQVCSATSRLLVQEGIAGALAAELTRRTADLLVGSPLDPSTQMGPITSSTQQVKVNDYLAMGRTEKLVQLVQGSCPEGAGYYVPPTIFWDVPVESRLWKEEIFGPVLCARRFCTEDQAIMLANGSNFGLAATVLSADNVRAQRVASELRVGNVWINQPQIIFPQGVWGGFKRSGFGRELGPEGVSAFLSSRSILAPWHGGS